MPALHARALGQPGLGGPLAQNEPVRAVTGAAAGVIRELLSSHELWCAQDLADAAGAQTPTGLPTGFEQLDRLLPDRGWPRAGLTEVLADAVGVGELRLLAPGLARLSREQPRWIAWVNPPFPPYAPALAEAGIEVGKVLLIRTDGFNRPVSAAHRAGSAADGNAPGQWGRMRVAHGSEPSRSASNRGRPERLQGASARRPGAASEPLWAVEQALQSGACSAVLAWLDERRLRLSDLRRLQLRTRQGRTWGVLFRPQRASAAPSAAELRLSVRAAQEGSVLDGAGTARRLLVSIIKRRGGWAIEDLPLELDKADDLRSLLQLWRRRRSGT